MTYSYLFGISFNLSMYKVNAGTTTIQNIPLESSSANKKDTFPSPRAPQVTRTIYPAFLILLTPFDFSFFKVVLMKKIVIFKY